MKTSPFKFLDSYTQADKDIFFGRSQEIEEIYSRLFYSNLLLVYGPSGSGKTSLLQCGVANRFGDLNWKPLFIRRNQNILQSLHSEIDKQSITLQKETKTVTEKLYSLYLDYLTPVYLIFDQFEELFIFGGTEEKKEFNGILKEIISHREINVQIILSIREEYLASLSEFEDMIPNLFENRIRIEKMNKLHAKEAIEGPCRVAGIELEDGVSEQVLERLSTQSGFIELTWLQVLMDTLYKRCEEINPNKIAIRNEDAEKLGKMGDVLGNFLEDQLKSLPEGEKGEALLKAMVSADGTKRQLTPEEIGTSLNSLGHQIPDEKIMEIFQQLIHVRIISDKDESGRYELKHDSLAAKIYEKLTLAEKELMEVRQFVEFAYQNYLARKKYLSPDDLKYIAPYEGKLLLNDDQNQFIKESKRLIQRKRRRKRNLVYMGGLLLILVLATSAILGYRAQKKAELQARIEKSKKLGNKAMFYIENDPTLSYLIAEEAWNLYPSFEAKKAILNSYKYSPFGNKIEGIDFTVSSSGNYFLCHDKKTKTLNIYDYSDKFISTCKGHTGEIWDAKFSENDKYIVTISYIDSTIRVFDIFGKQTLLIDKIHQVQYKIIDDTLIVYTLSSFRKYSCDGKLIVQKDFSKPYKTMKIGGPFIFGFYDSTLVLEDFASNEILKTNRSSIKISMDEIEFTEDKNFIIACDHFYKDVPKIIIWDLQNNKISEASTKPAGNLRSIYCDTTVFVELFHDPNSNKFYFYLRDLKGNIKLEKTLDFSSGNSIISKGGFWQYVNTDQEYFIWSEYEHRNTDIYYLSNGLQKQIEGSFQVFDFKEKKIITTIGNDLLTYNLKGEKLSSEEMNSDIQSFEISENKKYTILFSDKNLIFSEADKNGNKLIFWPQGDYFYPLNKNHFLIENANDAMVFSIKPGLLGSWNSSYMKEKEILELNFIPCINQILSIEKNAMKIWDYSGHQILSRTFELPLIEIADIKYSDNGEYFAINYENEESDCNLDIFSINDLSVIYQDSELCYSGPSFYDGGDTLAVIYAEGEDKEKAFFLNNNGDIIDEWDLPEIWNIVGKNHYEWPIQMNSKYISGYNNNNFYLFDIKTKDSLVFPSSINNKTIDHVYFQTEIPDLIFEHDEKNSVTKIFNLKMNPLGSFYYKGTFLNNFKIKNRNAIIGSCFKSKWFNHAGIHVGWESFPPYYFQFFDLESFSEIRSFTFNHYIGMNDISDDFKFILFGSWKLKSIALIFDTQEGKELIEFNAPEDQSNLSDDGKYLLLYDKDINKIRLFPLDPEEIINRIRVQKEFGEIRHLTEAEKKEYGIID